MKLLLLVVALSTACGSGTATTGTAEAIPLPDDSELGGPAAEPQPFVADQPAPPRDLTADELEPILARWYTSMSSLRDVFVAAGEDCARLALDLEAWVDENTASVAQLAADLAGIPDDQWEELVVERARNEPELLAPLQAGYYACSEHPEFQDIIARIDALAY